MALLENLSDSALRAKFAEYGYPVGPITESTRKILIKKLGSLMKEKKPVRQSPKNKWGLSSGESESESEHHGGGTKSFQNSFSSRRKSTPHNSSLNSRHSVAANLNVNPLPPVPSFTNTPPPRRATRGPTADSTRKTRVSSYELDSGSDSDWGRKSASNRSIFNTSNRTATIPVTPYNKESSRPFLSSLTRRLRLGNEMNPQDIKETDVDDNTNCLTTSPLCYRISQRTVQERGQYMEAIRTQLNLKGPMLMLSLFFIFFLWLGVTYYLRANQQRPAIAGKPSNVYPICTERDIGTSLCIPSGDLPLAVSLYRYVHQHLLSHGVKAVCDGSSKPYLTEPELVHFLLKARPADVAHIEDGVRHLAILLLSNAHWGIAVIRGDTSEPPAPPSPIPDSLIILPSDLALETPILFLANNLDLPFRCKLRLYFYNFMSYVVCLILVCLTLYAIWSAAKYVRRKSKQEEEEMMRLVDQILKYIHETCGSGAQFVAIRHVHDSLISPVDRLRMKPLWERAMKFMEDNESRVRKEIQQVWGEDTEVWRSLGQPPSPPPPAENNHLYPDLSNMSQREGQRVWQGEAFETGEGSMNSLPVSPTPCLKIRHMFQPNKDYGIDWEVAVKDAIIEKCEGSRIVHVAVDSQSREGCVYLKCNSTRDAGLAFRRLHGSWFDGALVTVKYLRLERYHERFPDSITCTLPLQPSNNLRLSLGGRQ